MTRTSMLAALLGGALFFLFAETVVATGNPVEPSAPRLALLGCDPTPDGFVVNLAQTNVHPDLVTRLQDDLGPSRVRSQQIPCLPVLARLLRSDTPPGLSVARLRAADSCVAPDLGQTLVWEGRRHGEPRVLLGCSLDEESQLTVAFASSVGNRDVASATVGSPCLDALTALAARRFKTIGPVSVVAEPDEDGSPGDRGLTWFLGADGLAAIVQCDLNVHGNLVTTYLESSVTRASDPRALGAPCLEILAAAQGAGGASLALAGPVPTPETDDCLIFDLGSGGPSGGGSAPCCACAPVCGCGVCP